MLLIHTLVMMWAWGKISPQLLQIIMSLFVQDLEVAMSDDEDLDLAWVRKLAGLGTSGSHPQNCNVELCGALVDVKIPKPRQYMLPLKHSVHGLLHRRSGIILPHEMFAAMYEQFHDQWVLRVCPSDATISKFWRSVDGGAQFQQHPVRFKDDFRRR